MTIRVGQEYIGAIDPFTDEDRLTDEVIVRCRDCAHFREFPGRCGMKYVCTVYPTFHHFTVEDGYCHLGIRKGA